MRTNILPALHGLNFTPPHSSTPELNRELIRGIKSKQAASSQRRDGKPRPSFPVLIPESIRFFFEPEERKPD